MGKIIYDTHYQTPGYFGKPYPKLVQFFNSREKNKTILDLGCGQGRDLLLLAELGYTMMGVDHSKVGIEQIARKARSRELKVDLVVADIFEYSIPESVDIVLLDSMLHFYKNDLLKETELVSAILNHLKTNGLFINCLLKGQVREKILKTIIEDSNSEWDTIHEEYIKYPESNSEYHFLVIEKK